MSIFHIALLVTMAIIFTFVPLEDSSYFPPLRIFAPGILFLIIDFILGSFLFISDCKINDQLYLAPNPEYCPFSLPGYGMIIFSIIMMIKGWLKKTEIIRLKHIY